MAVGWRSMCRAIVGYFLHNVTRHLHAGAIWLGVWGFWGICGKRMARKTTTKHLTIVLMSSIGHRLKYTENPQFCLSWPKTTGCHCQCCCCYCCCIRAQQNIDLNEFQFRFSFPIPKNSNNQQIVLLNELLFLLSRAILVLLVR